MKFLLSVFFVFSQAASACASSADTLKARTDTVQIPELKRAILDVFHSFYSMGYWDIRAGARSASNPWNYKYTYTTRIKIPGEKFNMLYSYPADNSAMDFVSVIKETDGYDKSLDAAYRQYEKLLLKQFPVSEGWVSSCIMNAGAEKLPDLEIHKENFGSVVLDYSRTPRGRYILFLRFLMY